MTQHADQSDRSRYGTVHERADGYQLRFERHLRHPVEKVWAALTSPAQLAQWLAPGEIELTLGGRVYLAFTDGDGVIDGRVTAIAPPRLLEFTWTDKGDDFGFVRWELIAEDGGTRLVLTHTVPEAARAFRSPGAGGVAFPARAVGGPARRPAPAPRGRTLARVPRPLRPGGGDGCTAWKGRRQQR